MHTCIFVSKISHRKNTLKFACKSLRVKARVKIYTRVFCVDFSWKSAILHAIYVCVSAAMPVACTVYLVAGQGTSCTLNHHLWSEITSLCHPHTPPIGENQHGQPQEKKTSRSHVFFYLRKKLLSMHALGRISLTMAAAALGDLTELFPIN